MYLGKRVGFVAPAYNEQKLIIPTLKGIPDYIDCIYIIDDCSTDDTVKVVEAYSAKNDPRIKVISHKINTGPGNAIITGYLSSSKDMNDITVVAGADHQFDLTEIKYLLDAIINYGTDYAKGNRFLVDAKEVMPVNRYLGNILLSMLTRIGSGNYKIFDTQDGFTAITKTVIDSVDWNYFWKGYGYPSDFIIKIAAYGFQISDVPRRSIYIPGERQSQINIKKYIKTFIPMIIKSGIWKVKNSKKLRNYINNSGGYE